MSLSRSHSLYRGQARRGIGEGGGMGVSRGEQYLHADPEVVAAGDLLVRLRPWMTLDSDPADRQVLREDLEAWSCCPVANGLVVVRLCSAGSFDNRAAYFSHGRWWPRVDLSAGFDPAAYVGQDRFFAHPWRDLEPAQVPPVPEGLPAPLRRKMIESEGQLATALLAHLLHACASSGAVCLAVPVGDFARGGTLASLVSFVRLALPAHLKRHCPLRVYTRHPEAFVGQLGAKLVVAPEEVGAEALAGRRDAVLLDRSGRRHAGGEPPSDALRYAQVAVEQACRFPDAVLTFSSRVSASEERTPRGPAETGALTLVYDLSVLETVSGGAAGQKVLEYLVARARDAGEDQFDWVRWVTMDDWARIPPQSLWELILRDSRDLRGDEAALQAAAARFAVARGWRADGNLGGVTTARLLALREQHPELVSALAVAERAHGLSTEERLSLERKATLLESEREAGTLRERPPGELAEMARDPDCLGILAELTTAGTLEARWAEMLVAKNELASGENLKIAHRLLSEPLERPVWQEAAGRLLDRLLLVRSTTPLTPQLLELADRLQPSRAHLGLALSLAAHLVGMKPEPPFTDELRSCLKNLESSADRQAVLSFLFDRPHPHLAPYLLLNATTGEIAVPWVRQHADRVMKHPFLLSRLRLADLLELVSTDAGAIHLSEEVAAELDRRQTTDPEDTTRHLVVRGAWFDWRCESRLPAPEIRRSAWSWLTCESWRTGSEDREPPEPTLEAWRQAVLDLLPSLSRGEVETLTGGSATGGATWPWIGGFENEQVRQLAKLITDPEGRERLARSVWTDREGRHLWDRQDLADTLGIAVDKLPGDERQRGAMPGLRAGVHREPVPADRLVACLNQANMAGVEKIIGGLASDSGGSIAASLRYLLSALPPRYSVPDPPPDLAIASVVNVMPQWLWANASLPEAVEFLRRLFPDRGFGEVLFAIAIGRSSAGWSPERWMSLLAFDGIGGRYENVITPRQQVVARALLHRHRHYLPASLRTALDLSLWPRSVRKSAAGQKRKEPPMQEPVVLLHSQGEKRPLKLRRRWGDGGWLLACLVGGENLARQRQRLSEATEENLAVAIKDLSFQDGAAGVVAEIFGDGDSHEVGLRFVGTGTARQGLLLTPGPRKVPLDLVTKKRIHLQGGKVLLVPVDEAAEGRLRQLVEGLECLPSDLETLMLDTLRQPGLEERIVRLETWTGVAEEATARRWYEQLRQVVWRWLTRPLPTMWFLIGVALLATVPLLAPHLKGFSGNKDGADPTIELTYLVPPGEQFAEPEPQVEPGSTEIKELFASLKAALPDSGGIPQKIYRTSFEGKTEEVDPVYGFAKLQLLCNDNDAKVEPTTRDYYTKTRDLVRTFIGAKKWTEEDSAALASVGCLLVMRPGLPPGGEVSNEELMMDDLTCANQDEWSDEAVAGLEKVLDCLAELES